LVKQIANPIWLRLRVIGKVENLMDIQKFNGNLKSLVS